MPLALLPVLGLPGSPTARRAALLPAELLLGTAGLEALERVWLFPTTGLSLAALPSRLLLATLLAGLLLVSPVRCLLAAELSLLTALRSASALPLQARVAVLSALPARLLTTRLSLEQPLLSGLGLWRLLPAELSLLATRLSGGTLLSGLALLVRSSLLTGLTRLPALLTELLLRSASGALLARLILLLPASLLARPTPLLHLVAPGRLCPLSASPLALRLLSVSLALVSRLPLLTLVSLLPGVSGLRLLPAELATLLALRWLLAGLPRLPALLSELLGVAALLARRGTALLAVWSTLLMASLLGGVARPPLASRCVQPPWLSLLAAPSLSALLAPLSAVLFASVLGVAVLPAHGICPGGRTRSSE